MVVRQDVDGSLLTEITSASRTLVFLTVPWSIYERKARIAFRSAAEELAAEHPELGVSFFILDEDAEWCQVWLTSLHLSGLGGGVSRGVGSMVWLECGRVVLSELGGVDLIADGIVARTLRLWDRTKDQ